MYAQRPYATGSEQEAVDGSHEHRASLQSDILQPEWVAYDIASGKAMGV